MRTIQLTDDEFEAVKVALQDATDRNTRIADYGLRAQASPVQRARMWVALFDKMIAAEPHEDE